MTRTSKRAERPMQSVALDAPVSRHVVAELPRGDEKKAPPKRGNRLSGSYFAMVVAYLIRFNTV